MKKQIIIALLASAIPAVSSAATIGNGADTLGGSGNFALGVEFDSIFSRDIKHDSSTPPLDPGDSLSDVSIESKRFMLKGSIGVLPNIDVFAKLGLADAKAEATVVSPAFPPSVKAEVNGDNDTAWGVGIKVKLWTTSPGGLKVLADMQYLAYTLDSTCQTSALGITVTCAAAIAPDTYTMETEVKETQLAIYLNQTFGMWSPYAGLKYSDMKVEWNYTDTTPDSNVDKFSADSKVGLLVGTDILINPQLSVALEARFVDESAATVGATWKF